MPPGVGQKLRFLPKSLYKGIQNLKFERLITFPNGSEVYILAL